MLTKSLPRALLLLFLATASGANASVLTFQGGTIDSTASSNYRTIEIDATRPGGNWANPTTFGALELKTGGSLAGAHLAAAENMVSLDFAAGIADLDKHSLKVDLFTGNPNLGSPLLQLIPRGQLPPPLTPLFLVSEPRTAAMLLGGLAVMGLASRRRKGN